MTSLSELRIQRANQQKKLNHLQQITGSHPAQGFKREQLETRAATIAQSIRDYDGVIDAKDEAQR